jgi:hypothetical protein
MTSKKARLEACMSHVFDWSLSTEAFPMSILLTSVSFGSLTAMVNLRLALRKCSASYFEQLAKAMPNVMLQRLKLSHTTTRSKYLAVFLGSFKDTLHSLTLDHVTINDNDTFDKLLSMCVDLLKLRKIVLQSLNVGNQGLYFGEFNKLRPLTRDHDPLSPSLYPHRPFADFDEADWVMVYICDRDIFGIQLCEDGGDDIGYWIRKVMDLVQVDERMWTEFDGYEDRPLKPFLLVSHVVSIPRRLPCICILIFAQFASLEG